LESFVIGDFSTDENFPEKKLRDVWKSYANYFHTSFEDFERSFPPKLLEHFGVVNQGKNIVAVSDLPF
jgi:hypothetical protein